MSRKIFVGAFLCFFFTSLTKLMELILKDLIGLYDERKCFSATANPNWTLSCLRIKRT